MNACAGIGVDLAKCKNWLHRLRCAWLFDRDRNVTLPANNLVGTLPNSVSLLSALTTVSFAQNFISGTIPRGLVAVTGLQYVMLSSSLKLHLSHFQIVLSLLFSSLSHPLACSFFTFSLARQHSFTFLLHSFFSGSILLALLIPSPRLPLLFSKMLNTVQTVSTRSLSLANNYLNGSIPDDVYKLAKLSALDVRSNNLTVSIINGISALTNLRYVSHGCSKFECLCGGVGCRAWPSSWNHQSLSHMAL